MKIVFTDFVVDHQRLPDGSIALKYIEAMEGEGPDGERGPVGTGNEFHARMTKEVATKHCIELAIALGLMEDKDKPEVADLGQMREEIKKRNKRRPKR